MSEFTASANLEVTPVGIDSAKREIERELGDLEVGVSASTNRPTGRQPRDPSTGRFMSREGPEQRLVELSDLAEVRNELLEELVEGGVGGGGGGGVGGGGNGPIIGAGLLAAGGLMLGAPAATFGQRLGRMNLDDPLSFIFGEQSPGSDTKTRVPEGQQLKLQPPDPWPPRLETPEGFPPELQLPAGIPPKLEVPQGFPPELQLPAGIPPELEVPQGFPPELQLPENFPPRLELPQQDFPPQLEIPPNLGSELQVDVPDNIQVDVPQELQRLANGNLGLNVDIGVDIPSAQQIQSDIQRAVENIIQEWFRNNFPGTGSGPRNAGPSGNR